MKKYIAVVLFSLLLLTASTSHAQSSALGIRDIQNQNFTAVGFTNITVAITNNLSQALSLVESIPSGWTLTRISDDASSFKASTNEWVWFNAGAGVTKTILYKLNVPASATSGTYYINGSISNSSGTVAGIEGENYIVVPRSTQTPEPTIAGGSGLVKTPVKTQKDSDLMKVETGINPAQPIAGGEISFKVELTYPTAGYIIDFGNASIKDKVISIYINAKPPDGMAAQVITTYSRAYNLGYLSEGDYAYSININGALVESGSFVVAPKTQETAPASAASPVPTEPLKTPGFTLPMTIVLISYIVIKIIKGDEYGGKKIG